MILISDNIESVLKTLSDFEKEVHPAIQKAISDPPWLVDAQAKAELALKEAYPEDKYQPIISNFVNEIKEFPSVIGTELRSTLTDTFGTYDYQLPDLMDASQISYEDILDWVTSPLDTVTNKTPSALRPDDGAANPFLSLASGKKLDSRDVGPDGKPLEPENIAWRILTLLNSNPNGVDLEGLRRRICQFIASKDFDGSGINTKAWLGIVMKAWLDMFQTMLPPRIEAAIDNTWLKAGGNV